MKRSRIRKKKKLEDERILNLKFVHAFGSSGSLGIKDSIDFYIDHIIHLVYPVGRYVVLKEYENNIMKKVEMKDNSLPVSCIAIDSEKKKIAIAQKGMKHPIISFVLTKKNVKEQKTYKDKIYSAEQNIY